MARGAGLRGGRDRGRAYALGIGRAAGLGAADRRGRPLRLCVPGGPRPDRPQARALGAAGTDAPLFCLIADRAQDRDAFRVGQAPQDIKAVIPARSRCTTPSPAPRNGTRRAPPEHGASAGSKGSAAWPLATPHTRRGAWVFCTWRRLGSG